MTNGYKFERVRINIRWIDYVRLKHSFPAERGESAMSYFRRLALYLGAKK